jgi:ribosomal protein S18 acetylase RimI-like enzyme
MSDTDTDTLMTGNVAVACTAYNYAQLADIYNQGRVDYIVPMPMNAKRMQEYVTAYDVDLSLSLVALDAHDQQANGLCMVGLRGKRAWITRLGVIPERRRRKTGEFLIRQVLARLQAIGVERVQLEVIRGNEPAQRLFEKFGFVITRNLHILRRPPAPLAPTRQAPQGITHAIIEDQEAIQRLLETRDDAPTWLEETKSLMNTGEMRAIVATLADDTQAWLAFQRLPFQLTHFVFCPTQQRSTYDLLLSLLHEHYPLQDTKVENIPSDSPLLPHYYALGYVEAFQRIEMVLPLAPSS